MARTRLVDVSVYLPTDGDAFDYLVEAHETAAYLASQFEGGAVTLERLRVQLEAERVAGNVTDAVARSLATKLAIAAYAFDRGNDATGCDVLEAFGRQLVAQHGAGVNSDAFGRLAPLSQQLEDALCAPVS